MRTILRSLIPLALLVAAPAAAQEKGVVEHRLANGLTVLLRPIPAASQVAVVVLYSVGGRHDPGGRSGLAHLVEHLYVTAAAGKTPARTAEELMASHPLGWNAQTGDDFTVIATVAPADAIGAELDDAAARMGDLRPAAADLARELPRMQVELGNMYGGMPMLAAPNAAREKLRPGPAGSRHGGFFEQIAPFPLEDVVNRWRRFYKPANALLVVAGKFDPDLARAEIERRFGPIPSGEPAPERAVGTEPKPGEAAPDAGAPAEACVAWPAPRPGEPGFAGSLVLVARLWQRSQALASEPGRFPVRYAPLDDPGILYLSAPIASGERSADVFRRIEAIAAETAAAPFESPDTAAARDFFGFLLGCADLPDFAIAANPYGVAFGLGRRRQLGLDPAKLAAELRELTPEGLRASAAFLAPERAVYAIAPVR